MFTQNSVCGPSKRAHVDLAGRSGSKSQSRRASVCGSFFTYLVCGVARCLRLTFLCPDKDAFLRHDIHARVDFRMAFAQRQTTGKMILNIFAIFPGRALENSHYFSQRARVRVVVYLHIPFAAGQEGVRGADAQKSGEA